MAQWPTRTTPSGAVVIRPEGRLNLSTARQLREQLRSLVSDGYNHVVVDLAGVISMDSTGVGALISGLKATREAGGDLRITAPRPVLRAVLELTGLHRVLQTLDSAEDAF